MKSLKTIRVILSVVCLLAAVVYLAIGPEVLPVASLEARSQILLSAVPIGMGTIIVWILISFLFGRVYCSTFCPIGTIQDVGIRLRRKISYFNRPFSYKKSRNIRFHFLVVYLICLVVGVMAVPYWIEPWNMMRNICSIVNPTAVEATWINLGLGVGAGIASGILSLILLLICSLFTGRGFCTDICPVGTLLGCFHNYSLFNIEIDPDKCISCMKCEEICKSQCVKVVGRYVDNSRCVRCFNCISVCPNDAIRLQPNRNRRGTPLIQKVGRTKA